MIDPMPLNFHLLCLFPESFLTITLGVMFLGVYIKWTKILITALVHSVVMYIIVNNFNIEFQVVYSSILLLIFTTLIMDIGFKNSIVSMSAAIAVGILLKGTSMLVLLRITDITIMEVFLKNWLRFVFLIPYFFELVLIIVLVRKYKLVLKPSLNTN